MTLDETKKVIAVIISAYPNYHPADIKAVVSVWKELLEEHSYECVSTALRMYMSTANYRTGKAAYLRKALERN